MAASRIACVFVPLFPLAARLRSEPDLAGQALAVFSGNGGAARVVAASRAARRAGVRCGLSLAQARAAVPKLMARGNDPECERSAREALLEAAESFSPRVEDGGDGIAYVDLEGLDCLWASDPDGPGAEAGVALRRLGQSVVAAVEAAGLPARVGIATGKLVARVAADAPESPVVVPPGLEAQFLSALPLVRLSPPPEISEILRRWGLSTIGDLARLSEADVESRLGRAGRELHRAAQGIDPRPLLPRRVPPVFHEGMDLEWPLVALEPFLFVARAAFDRLVQRLCSHALSCSSLDLTLKLDPEGVDARTVRFPAPTRDVKTLLTLTRLDLEKRPPQAPIAGFRFTAHPDRPRFAQLSLFDPPELSPDRLAAALGKLAARIGPDRIGSPVVADSHLPERFQVAPYAPSSPPDSSEPPRRGRGLLAVRVLRPPVPLEVETEERRPKAILPGARSEGEEAARVEVPLGQVRVASGPWRIEEEGWRQSGVERDYWDVDLAGGGLYRIFEDRKSGDWFADGIYD